MTPLTGIKADALPQPLSPLGGGFYVGTLLMDGRPHALIISPKAEGDLANVCWHTESDDVTGATSYVDGLANTEAMAQAGSKLAQTIRALSIGGAEDWALAARDQQELIYRVCKPTTWKNACTFRDGENPSALPATYPYTPDSPAQTSNELFREGGSEALESVWYWTSTQASARCAWGQYFLIGLQGSHGKEFAARARAVRMIPIIN